MATFNVDYKFTKQDGNDQVVITSKFCVESPELATTRLLNYIQQGATLEYFSIRLVKPKPKKEAK